jgi:hypothetical protein
MSRFFASVSFGDSNGGRRLLYLMVCGAKMPGAGRKARAFSPRVGCRVMGARQHPKLLLQRDFEPTSSEIDK